MHKTKRTMIQLTKLILLTLLSTNLLAQSYIMEHYTYGDGLLSDFSTAILQEKNGFMLFGTIDGLCYYNGKEFSIFHDPLLSNEQVISLYTTSDSIIFVGKKDGFTTISNLKYFKNFTLPKIDSIENVVYSFLELGKSKLLIGTRTGIFEFKNNILKRNKKYKILNNLFIYSITTDKNNNYYFATNQGLFYLNGKNNSIKKIISETIYAISSHNGIIWGLSDIGLFKGTQENFQYDSYEFKATNRFQSILFDKEGNVVFQQDTKIIFYNNKKIVREISGKNFSPIKSSIYNLFFDRNNSLWISTLGEGIYHIDNMDFTYFHNKNGIKAEIFKLLETKSKNIIAGSDGQGILQYNGERFSPIPWSRKLNSTIWTFFEDSKSNFWLSTTDNIYVKTGDEIINITQKFNVQTSTPMSFYEEKGIFGFLQLKKEFLFII